MPPSSPPTPPPLPAPPICHPPKKEKQRRTYFSTSCFKRQYLGNINLMWNKNPFFLLIMTTLPCSLSCWKLNHGSAEPQLAVHRCIKVLLFTPTHTQSRHTRLKKKDWSLFSNIWFLLKWCGSAVFYCGAIFWAAVCHGYRSLVRL